MRLKDDEVLVLRGLADGISPASVTESRTKTILHTLRYRAYVNASGELTAAGLHVAAKLPTVVITDPEKVSEDIAEHTWQIHDWNEIDDVV
jgi:hypothetical protein